MKFDYNLEKWFPGGLATEEINWDFGYPDTDDVMILMMNEKLSVIGSSFSLEYGGYDSKRKTCCYLDSVERFEIRLAIAFNKI